MRVAGLRGWSNVLQLQKYWWLGNKLEAPYQRTDVCSVSIVIFSCVGNIIAREDSQCLESFCHEFVVLYWVEPRRVSSIMYGLRSRTRYFVGERRIENVRIGASNRDNDDESCCDTCSRTRGFGFTSGLFASVEAFANVTARAVRSADRSQNSESLERKATSRT